MRGRRGGWGKGGAPVTVTPLSALTLGFPLLFIQTTLEAKQGGGRRIKREEGGESKKNENKKGGEKKGRRLANCNCYAALCSHALLSSALPSLPVAPMQFLSQNIQAAGSRYLQLQRQILDNLNQSKDDVCGRNCYGLAAVLLPWSAHHHHHHHHQHQHHHHLQHHHHHHNVCGSNCYGLAAAPTVGLLPLLTQRHKQAAAKAQASRGTSQERHK